MSVKGGSMWSKTQLDTSNRPTDDTVYLDAFANRYSEVVRRLRRVTHSSLWETSKPTSGNAAEKKK